MGNKLLTDQSGNMKLAKNNSPTWALSLAPGNLSGHEVCPYRTAGCTHACVAKAGNAIVFPRIMQARIRKTQWFFKDRAGFLAQLNKELSSANEKCRKNNVIGLVRLNTFSDISWEHIIDLGQFTNLRFYDYTKNIKRAEDSVRSDVRYVHPDGTPYYRLCYSINENTDLERAKALLRAGGTVAVVFGDIKYRNGKNKGDMHPQYWGFPVVDGDATDDRFNDPRGCVVGLRLKGTNNMRKVAVDSGFARTTSVQLTVRGA